MAFTLDDLDNVFTYHKWSGQQVELGGKIRAAAKDLARAIIESQPTQKAFPIPPLASACRDHALTLLRIAVQEANAAITFEAAELEAI